jgi:non-heme chloroperoxidase
MLRSIALATVTMLPIYLAPAQIVPSPSADQTPIAWHDPSPHSTQMVRVDKDVQLEVLDWGGSGRTVVLLAGLGNTAHIFDDFAPKLAGKYHVYGITRRGFGVCSVPATGYGADRLADDVLAVLDTLKIERPVLVGHSIAGQELSSIGVRHPERVAGLIYLAAAYSYAFYDREHGDYNMDLRSIQNQIEQLEKEPFNQKYIQQLEAGLPGLEHDLQVAQKNPPPWLPQQEPTPADLASFSAMRSYMAGPLGGLPPESELHQSFTSTPQGGIGGPRNKSFVSAAILAGEQKYTDIEATILAIFTIPQDHGANVKATAAQLASATDAETANTERQAQAFEKGLPSARVVRLAHANHYVFISNESDVLREMTAFIDSLK